MLEQYLLFIIGIFLLIKGASYIVDGASSLATKMNIPIIIIGITIVSIGTTMPELVVNIISAIKGSTEVAFGNIIGSNIANILLIIGLTAVIYPIKVERTTIWKEIPIMLIAIAVLFVVSNSVLIDKVNVNTITRTGGIILLFFFVVFIYYSIKIFKQTRKKLEKTKIEIKKRTNLKIWLMIIGGLVCLFIGGKWAVDGAIFTARQLGLSEFLISASIIAIGTSLPELVTGITAAKKHKTDIVIGNVAGANIFNIFWVLGITAIIAPIAIPSFVNIDIMIMGIATILLLSFIFIGKSKEIERWQGVLFLIMYVGYIIFISLRG